MDDKAELASGKVVKPPSLPSNLGVAGAQGKEVAMGVSLGLRVQFHWLLWEFTRKTRRMQGKIKAQLIGNTTRSLDEMCLHFTKTKQLLAAPPSMNNLFINKHKVMT